MSAISTVATSATLLSNDCLCGDFIDGVGVRAVQTRLAYTSLVMSVEVAERPDDDGKLRAQLGKYVECGTDKDLARYTTIVELLNEHPFNGHDRDDLIGNCAGHFFDC
mmetsp:Transcript_91014/g.293835  ORF Transcript_91014/g.293835 Transcript_91014/m.293835 type:complete len:108 (+) Transcript_91014:383-706(+)